MKEVIDQTAHVVLGFILAFLGMIGRVHIWAAPLAFCVAYGILMMREYYQHKRVVWVNFDLYFGMGGSVAGAIVPFFVFGVAL